MPAHACQIVLKVQAELLAQGLRAASEGFRGLGLEPGLHSEGNLIAFVDDRQSIQPSWEALAQIAQGLPVEVTLWSGQVQYQHADFAELGLSSGKEIGLEHTWHHSAGVVDVDEDQIVAARLPACIADKADSICDVNLETGVCRQIEMGASHLDHLSGGLNRVYAATWEMLKQKLRQGAAASSQQQYAVGVGVEQQAGHHGLRVLQHQNGGVVQRHGTLAR